MKAKRAARRKIPAAIVCLLVLVTVPIVLIMATASSCDIPREVSFSQQFLQSRLESDHSEVDLVELIYDEVSRNLAWHGTVDFVGYYSFQYICQSDSCDLEAASVQTPVHHYPLCTYDRRVRGTIVVVDIDFSESRIETRLYGSKWKSSAGPVWDEISSDIASIKQYAIDSIGDDIWDIHHSLVLKTGKIPGGWSASIRTIDGSLIRWEEVDYFAYQKNREEKQ